MTSIYPPFYQLFNHLALFGISLFLKLCYFPWSIDGVSEKECTEYVLLGQN